MPLQIYSNTTTLPVNLEILSLSPLLVSEGEHVLVTSDNIGMVLDIAKYGVGEEGVVFTLVTPPTYGTLALDLLTTRSDHSFTLQDINQDKVTARSIHQIRRSTFQFVSSRPRRDRRDVSVHLSATRARHRDEARDEVEEFRGNTCKRRNSVGLHLTLINIR